MERRSAILPIVLMALSAIGVGLQAAEEQNAKYTVRIARNGVVTKDGTVYLAHSQLGKLPGLVVVSPSSK
jgi:hypothetical protein